jgi:putative acetyltransferase
MCPPEVVSFSPDLAPQFEALNREWIEQFFAIEQADLDVFRDPFGKIVAPGGQIFFVLNDRRVEGTCAVVRHASDVYELAKMAVTRRAQGLGLGNLLIATAIKFAREAGAQKLILLTNSRLGPALHLYEKYGFKRVPIKSSQGYSRADIEMELSLSA